MGIAISTCCNAWRAPLQLLCGPADEFKPGQDLIEYAGLLVDPQPTATHLVLTELQDVKNARDLSEACSSIQSGKVFRSACPASASAEDTELLRHRLGISVLIDLRSSEERKEDPESLLMEGALSEEFAECGNMLDEDAPETVKSSAEGQSSEVVRLLDGVVNGDADTGAGSKISNRGGLPSSLVVYHVALLEKERYYRALLGRLPWCTAATALFWALFNRSYSIAVVLGEVNRGGLGLLYEILLESSSKQILMVMKVVLQASEAGRPVLFFCKIGKDRTGLIAALILAACGASDIEIISDYARSQGTHGVALGGLEKVKELKGLDHKLFASAPPSAMATMLESLRLRHGSAAQYLVDIGFGTRSQERLRLSLQRQANADVDGNLPVSIKLEADTTDGAAAE